MSAALPGSELSVRDTKACKQWLESLPLTNVHQAHLAITGQLALLNTSNIAASEIIKVLEMLRETVDFLQTETAKKVLLKPLPFNPAEQAAWESIIVLWQTIYRSYEKCFEALESGQLSSGHTALICHRCVRYITQLMFEHFRVYQEFEPVLWLQLHKYYIHAEENRCDDEALKDSLNPQVSATSVYAAYTQGLLLHHANPFDLSIRQQQQMDRWLDRLSQKIRPSKTLADSPVPALAVDTEFPSGLQPAPKIAPGSSVRYLNMEKLSSSLRKRVKLLRSGAPTSELDLGEDCVQPSCEALLVYLHQQWCETPAARSSQRQEKNEKIQLCFGMPAIHYFITGRTFGQPNKPKTLSSKEMQEIAIFGRVSSQENKVHISQLGFAIETWNTLDESYTGYRLSRDAKSGSRISSKQIVATRSPEDSTFSLGSIRWLMLSLEGKLIVGIQMFSGTLQAVSVRPAGINAINEKFTQAFMLTPKDASQELPSLILPPRLYQPNRYIELHNETIQTVKLLEALDRGNDYDRVTFVID